MKIFQGCLKLLNHILPAKLGDPDPPSFHRYFFLAFPASSFSLLARIKTQKISQNINENGFQVIVRDTKFLIFLAFYLLQFLYSWSMKRNGNPFSTVKIVIVSDFIFSKLFWFLSIDQSWHRQQLKRNRDLSINKERFTPTKRHLSIDICSDTSETSLDVAQCLVPRKVQFNVEWCRANSSHVWQRGSMSQETHVSRKNAHSGDTPLLCTSAFNLLNFQNGPKPQVPRGLECPSPDQPISRYHKDV